MKYDFSAVTDYVAKIAALRVELLQEKILARYKKEKLKEMLKILKDEDSDDDDLFDDSKGSGKKRKHSSAMSSYSQASKFAGLEAGDV